MSEGDDDKNWWERNVEDGMAELADKERAQLPEDQRLSHDIAVGAFKGVYGGGKSLVTGLVDLAAFAVKVKSGDPATYEKIWHVTKKVASEGYIAEFGTPEEKADQNRRAYAAIEDVAGSLKQKVQSDWEQAKKEGKTAELISQWTARGVFEVAALLVGAGEVKAAAKVGELGELSKVGEVGSIVTKCPVKLAEEAAEAEKAIVNAEKLGSFEMGGQGSATAKYLEGVEQHPYTPGDPVLGQSQTYACGAASCRMAAGLGEVPEAYIRDALGTTENGTRFADIPDGLRQLGFEGTATYTESATAQSLADASQNGFKSVISVWQGANESHAVVLDGISDGMAYIRDPWPAGVGSSYAIPVDALQKSLTGRAVMIRPGA